MWEASGPRDVLLSAAGSHPGDLHKLWRTRTPNGYHMEYGYSCMGYEIPGAMGAKLADATGGRLTPRLYPSMQLGGEKEEIEQAQPGAPAWTKSTARRCRPSSNNRGSHENENGPGLYIKPGHDELTSEVQCFVRLV